MKIALIAEHLGGPAGIRPTPIPATPPPPSSPSPRRSRDGAIASPSTRAGFRRAPPPSRTVPRRDCRVPRGRAAGPAPGRRAAPAYPGVRRHLAERWRRGAPDIAHGHGWTSGLAALAGARDLDIPVVQTFHSLGAAPSDLGPPPRAWPPGSGWRPPSAAPPRRARRHLRRTRRALPPGCAASVGHIVPAGVDTVTFEPSARPPPGPGGPGC